jgi:hypothetical protein
MLGSHVCILHRSQLRTNSCSLCDLTNNKCLDSAARQLVTSEGGVCGKPLLVLLILLRLCPILHFASHWLVLDTPTKCFSTGGCLEEPLPSLATALHN